MVLDNSELVATGDPIPGPGGQAQVLTLSAAIGGGIGAHFAFVEGTLTGTALITAWGAGMLGVGAAGVAGVAVGTVIGETDFVRDNLLELMESIWPIGHEPKPEISVDVPWAPGESFSVNFGGESVQVDFYADTAGVEGFSMDTEFNSGTEFFANPYDAYQMEIEILGGGGLNPDFYYSYCGASGVIPP